MDQNVFLQQLEKAGVNTEQAIGRFMGNTALFLRFIQRLPEALCFSEIRKALREQDDENFYMLVHTLKGTAANLSAEKLAECAQAILVEYRSSGFKHMHKLESLIREIELESERLSKVLREMDAAQKDG